MTSDNKKPVNGTLFIEQNDIITDSLMTTVNGSKVIVADSSIIQGKLGRNGSFILHKLFPLAFEKGKFHVSVLPFSVTETNGEVYFTNSGTFKLEYLFDSRMKEFRFARGKSYGY